MANELPYGVEAVNVSADTCVNCGREIVLSALFNSDYTFAVSGLVGKKGYHYWYHRNDSSYFCDHASNHSGTQPIKPSRSHGVQNVDYKALYEQVIDRYEQLVFQLEDLKREKNNLIGMQLPLPLVPVHD